MLARVHSKNWIHGDMHTSNVLVVPNTAKLNVIDWARANRKELVVGHHPRGKEAGLRLWRRALINDIAFVYRDYVRSNGKVFADAMLNAYRQNRGRALQHVSVEAIRTNYEHLITSNVNAMFNALSVVSNKLARGQ
jgi:aminoglycoside phosphotransferase (APT) family kinase protein